MTNKDIGENIATINANLKNLTKNFEEYKNDNKKFVENITKKVDNVENKQIATSTKVGNLAVFQSIFSVIIGAIATYLGVQTKSQ